MSNEPKFPHPGEAPPKPSGEVPPYSDKLEWEAWNKTASKFNEYIRALRSHHIENGAEALVEEDSKDPIAIAMMILMKERLEVGPPERPSMFGGLFGGGL